MVKPRHGANRGKHLEDIKLDRFDTSDRSNNEKGKTNPQSVLAKAVNPCHNNASYNAVRIHIVEMRALENPRRSDLTSRIGARQNP